MFVFCGGVSRYEIFSGGGGRGIPTKGLEGLYFLDVFCFKETIRQSLFFLEKRFVQYKGSKQFAYVSVVFIQVFGGFFVCFLWRGF